LSQHLCFQLYPKLAACGAATALQLGGLPGMVDVVL